MSALTASARGRARRAMTLFQGFNTISFLLLSGNITTLFALRLGASGLFVGVLASFQYIGFLFMFVGRWLADRYGVLPVMAGGWITRYFLMLPLFAAPFVAIRGDLKTGLLLIALGLFGFHMARGVGVIGFNPTIGIVSEGKDRGAYLARLQIVNQIASILVGLLVVTALGSNAPLSRYAVLIFAGIVTGIVSALMIFRLPAPRHTPSAIGTGLFEGVRSAVTRRNFRQFIILFTVMSAVLGMADPFRIVYAKDVYGQPDNLIILFTVVGNIGAIMMGLLSRFLIDRLGAKPLFVLFSAFLVASVVPLALTPSLSAYWPEVFLSTVFFFFQLGMVGASSAAQNYFFAIITSEEFLNLGILYNLCNGIGGAFGSLLGGTFLDVLRRSAGPAQLSFRWYYIAIFVFVALILVSVARLSGAGRYSVRNALNIIFSPRDLRAFALLSKLERSKTIDQEVEALRAIGESGSHVPLQDVLQKLKHPRFYVRQQALRALEELPADPRVTRALINEVRNHQYTTAYVAARIIGRRGLSSGIKVLRASLDSHDYLLQANAMVALARLGDHGSIPMIERAMTRTRNPLVLIHAATALDELKSSGSIPLLIELLKLHHAPPFLRDEIILSIAGIIGIGEWFYAHYARFLEAAHLGDDSLDEYLLEHYDPTCGVPREEIAATLSILFRNTEEFSRRIVKHLVQLSANNRGPLNLVAFIEAAADDEISRFERFWFLLAGLVVWSACETPPVRLD